MTKHTLQILRAIKYLLTQNQMAVGDLKLIGQGGPVMESMWFGIRGTGPAYRESPQTETPVGQGCRYCEESILPGENGWIMRDGAILHQECQIRMIIGSVAHQEKR